MKDTDFAVRLTRRDDYQFDVDFDHPHVHLTMDEPEPLGNAQGPNATRVLAAAIGNCLSASLLFCLQKAHVEVDGLSAVVRGSLARNEQGRMRVSKLSVELAPEITSNEARTARCLEIFEDYCLVTQSVRDGIEVDVKVALPNPVGP